MRLSYRLVSGLLVLASIVGMSFALYLEHVKGWSHVRSVFSTCWLNGNGFCGSYCVLHNPVSMRLNAFMHFGRCCNFMVSGVAGRHVWLQHLPPDQVPSCGRV